MIGVHARKSIMVCGRYRICQNISSQLLIKLPSANCVRFMSNKSIPKLPPVKSIFDDSSGGKGSSQRFSAPSGVAFKPNLKLIGGLIAAGVASFGLYKFSTRKRGDSSDIRPRSGRRLMAPSTRPKRSLPPVTPNSEIPDKVPYVIVGTGTAAFSAFRAIRSSDARAQVLLVGEELDNPYMRPPLSKELWFCDDKKLVYDLKFKQWSGKERSVFYEKDQFYTKPVDLVNSEKGGVALVRGRMVTKVDAAAQKITLDSGKEIAYDKCLLATGGRPKNVPVIQNAGAHVQSRVTLFRTIADFEKLDGIVGQLDSIAVIGGGFLGSELACALGKRGQTDGFKVTQLFPESGNMGKVLPEYLCRWTTGKIREEGVTVLPFTAVTGCEYDSCGCRVKLLLNNGESISVDHVIVAVGLEPNTDLAGTSGLEVDPKYGGFLVNAELAARKNLYAAGDAACFYDVCLGRRRVEHHDHAVVSGRLAGENMSGGANHYTHQSMFWSDLGPNIGYEAIGIIDSSLPTVGVFARATETDTPQAQSGDGLRSEAEAAPCKVDGDEEANKKTASANPYGKGVIFYTRDDKLVGILLWNVFNKMSIARRLLKEGKKYDDYNEVAKLFNIHGEEEEPCDAGA